MSHIHNKDKAFKTPCDLPEGVKKLLAQRAKQSPRVTMHSISKSKLLPYFDNMAQVKAHGPKMSEYLRDCKAERSGKRQLIAAKNQALAEKKIATFEKKCQSILSAGGLPNRRHDDGVKTTDENIKFAKALFSEEVVEAVQAVQVLQQERTEPDDISQTRFKSIYGYWINAQEGEDLARELLEKEQDAHNATKEEFKSFKEEGLAKLKNLNVQAEILLNENMNMYRENNFLKAHSKNVDDHCKHVVEESARLVSGLQNQITVLRQIVEFRDATIEQENERFVQQVLHPSYYRVVQHEDESYIEIANDSVEENHQTDSEPITELSIQVQSVGSAEWLHGERLVDAFMEDEPSLVENEELVVVGQEQLIGARIQELEERLVQDLHSNEELLQQQQPPRRLQHAQRISAGNRRVSNAPPTGHRHGQDGHGQL